MTIFKRLFAKNESPISAKPDSNAVVTNIAKQILRQVPNTGAALVIRVDENGQMNACLQTADNMLGDLCADALVDHMLPVRSNLRSGLDARKRERKKLIQHDNDTRKGFDVYLAKYKRAAADSPNGQINGYASGDM